MWRCHYHWCQHCLPIPLALHGMLHFFCRQLARICSLRASSCTSCTPQWLVLSLRLANWILIAPLVLRLWVSLAQRLRGGHWSICQWHNGQHCQPFVPIFEIPVAVYAEFEHHVINHLTHGVGCMWRARLAPLFARRQLRQWSHRDVSISRQPWHGGTIFNLPLGYRNGYGTSIARLTRIWYVWSLKQSAPGKTRAESRTPQASNTLG